MQDTISHRSTFRRLTMSLRRGLVPAITIASLTSRAAPAQTRVIVNRREVRVTFPRDTAHTWGWSERKDPGYYPFYIWSISVDGMDGPRSLSLHAGRRGDEARHFASLASLVAAGEASLCLPGM